MQTRLWVANKSATDKDARLDIALCVPDAPVGLFVLRTFLHGFPEAETYMGRRSSSEPREDAAWSAAM